MADPVSENTVEPVAPPESQQLPRHRFGIAYLALAAVLGAAVGLFVVLAANGGKDSGPAWSAWKPATRGVQRLTEIATYVSGRYALPSGGKLVGAYSTPPVVQLQGQLAAARAISVGTGLRGETLNDAQIYDATSAWAYELCGFGKDCAIAEGKASAARGRLLQRQALELALYTFKYEPSINFVVTYFPPASGQQPAAVFLRRADLADPLRRPLAETLPPAKARLAPGKMRARDLQAVRRYIPEAFTYSGETMQDGSPLLMLSPAS